ncbi:MAG: choice-of-anchor K domain-containing protein [Verrucomicrobiaceae bacterium]|nr:choice-of-anchor K domain-containing protein [Verrucomicrobiaceae bacterium]
MTIAIVAALATISVSLMTDDSGSVHQAKLESDVATLNQMVALYVADGGDLAGLTNPQTILDKMKRVRPQAEWQRHAGAASGRLVDVRLRARVTSAREPGEVVRAAWNRTKQRFEITGNATGDAVSEFYLDESLASADFGTETRRSTIKNYNSSTRGWVWNASTRDPTANYLNPSPITGNGQTQNFNPSESAPSTGPGGGTGGGGGGSGGGGGGGGGGTTPPTALPAPSISPGGGTYAFASFPSSVTINRNGAIPTASRLMVRVNGGAWSEFAGGEYSPLLPSMRIEARNEAVDPVVWLNSGINSKTFYRLTAGFSGSGSGSWGNATGGANLVRTIENGAETSTLKHGNTKLDLGNGQYLDAGVENVLTFTREQFDTVTPNTWFKFGELVMLNGTTFYDSEATGVTLSVNLNMTEPSVSMVTHVDFNLISTENTSDRLASADIVELKNPTTDAKIIIDGVEYTLELAWATLDPGAGVVQGSQFLIFEGASARAELRARFKSNR